MPKRKTKATKTKRTYHKRMYGKKRKYKNYSPRIPRTNFLTKDAYDMKLRYVDYVQISRNSTNDYGYATFKVNSIVQPAVDKPAEVIQGISPMRDIWYNYCVHGAKFKITAMKLETSCPLALFAWAQDSTQYADAFVPTWDTLMEQRDPSIAYKTLTVGGFVSGDSVSHLNTYDKRCVLKKYYSLKRLTSKTDVQSENDNWGVVGAHVDDGGDDPLNLYYAKVGWSLPDAYTGTQPTLDLAVEIVYYVRFFNRRETIPNPSSTTSGSLLVDTGANIRKLREELLRNIESTINVSPTGDVVLPKKSV